MKLNISIITFCISIASLFAQEQIETKLKISDLDSANYAEWVDGTETKITPKDDRDKSGLPEGVILIDKDKLAMRGRDFGKTKTAGRRYLRVGFKEEQPITSVLTIGNVDLSILKTNAVYPGKLDDDSQWVPAKRIEGSELTSNEGSDSSSSVSWILPPGTRTRALRFKHTAKMTNKYYQGELKGAYVLPERYVNLAPQATIVARSNNDKGSRLNNDSMDGFWGAWGNIDGRNGKRVKTISEDPEWLMTVWDKPVNLSGIAFLFPGFRTADIQTFIGPTTRHPRDAKESDWKTIKKASGLRNLYPTTMGLNLVPFDKALTTRALRIRITSPEDPKECHPHIQNKIRDGKRIWLGEIYAFSSLDDKSPEGCLPEDVKKEVLKIGIPIKFKLPEDGYVTLVIEDKSGKRVRNLVSETFFPKGKNIAWWDGTDDLGRDRDAANHGLYKIPAQFVTPGDYKVRGLWRKKIKTFYEFGVYNDGNPPWNTSDHTGAWLANHSAPSSAMFVPAEKSPTGEPAVFLGCYVTEGPDGLGWVDLDGRKMGGKKWIGGHWTAAPYLGRDDGEEAVEGVYGYVASAWETGKNSGKMELRITPITSGNDERNGTKIEMPSKGKPFSDYIGGIAVRDAVAACSIPKLNKIMFVNTKEKKVVGECPVPSPAGLTYDNSNNLLIISEKRVISITVDTELPAKTVISKGLEKPVALTVDKKGNIYVSDRGTSHQVKVFSPTGEFILAIGQPGIPKAGPYDKLHMNNPAGIAIDSRDQLWVTEEDYMPKRVSVWTLDGKFIKAFYGPSKYGGGGVIDSENKNRFYYADERRGTMEFALDWEKGKSDLINVLYRRQPTDLELPFRSAAPENAIYRKTGGKEQRYFSNCFNSNPTGGHGTGFVFMERDKILHPVAGMGRGQDWLNVLSKDEFKSKIPEGIDLEGQKHQNQFFFIWSDLNLDGQVQPKEVHTSKAESGGITVLPDFSFCISRLGENRDNFKAYRFRPIFTSEGVPQYDFSKKEVLADGTMSPGSSGGDQVLVDKAGNVVVTLGIKPFDQHSISGAKNGKATWSYPNLWPGLHASHHGAKPTFPGEIIGVTRLLGETFTLPNSEVGALWGVNANMGNMYVFTTDGLFVATIFKDVRQGKLWRMPAGKRGMDLEGISLHDENFWPSITMTPDGKVYMMSGATTCIVKIEGLDTIRKISSRPIKVTAADLAKTQEQMMQAEGRRKLKEGGGVMKVALNSFTPVVDGKVDEWPDNWVEIERSGAGANFNSDAKPYDYRGTIAVADGKLFVAWKTADKKLLDNSGEMRLAPFKTGGTLELMLGTKSLAGSKQRHLVDGDIRLLVTKVDGKTYAMLYRPVAPGTKTPKVPFSSPWRTFEFDRVDNVSDQVTLADDGNGNYEISVPLTVLGLKPYLGMRINGDIGLLRGNGSQTLARIYWSNKATAIVSDVPSEAQLTPSLWGVLEFGKYEK